MLSNNTYIITEQQHSNFKPTYLYIKQHSVTGLKYFGKTGRDPYKYNGSGTHWKNHLKKHGKQIETIWVHLFNDINELISSAITLSEIFDIVDSNFWANMRIEDGLSGGDTSTSENYKKGMLSRNTTKENNPMFGKSRPDTAIYLRNAKDKMIQANRCPVNCEGIEYSSVGEAQNNFPGINIRKRLDNPKYPQFYRLKEKKNIKKG